MATVLKVVRCDLAGTDVDSVDLMGGLGAATGIVLLRDGWVQQIAAPGAESVVEVFALRLKGSSNDNLAALVQSLDAKVKQVLDWLADPNIERYLVVLRVKMYNETSERQAFVRAMTGASVPVMSLPAQLDSDIGEYALTIERASPWEDTAPYPSTAALNNLNALGGKAALSETIRGDVAARVARLTITPDAGTFGKYWVGWKTNRFGTAANFVPVWTWHNAFLGDDTTTTVDATAYNGTRITIDFAATEALSWRTIKLLLDHSGSVADQRGSYSVVLRAKMSDTSIARVQLYYGFGIGGGTPQIYNPTYHSRAVISGTNWKLYDVGSVQIPSHRLQPSDLLDNFAIGLLAERYSGAGALHLDCSILIPKDDGMIKLTSAAEHGSTISANAFTGIDDQIEAHTIDTPYVKHPILAEPTRWGITPRDDAAQIVMAADGLTTANAKTTTLDVTYSYVPRWLTLRGSET